MNVSEFTAQVASFDALGVPERLKLFAWYLHTHRKLPTFDRSDVKQCFVDLHLVCPDLSIYFPRLLKQRVFLKEAGKVKLEGKVRGAIDKKYGETQVTIAVTAALSQLPARIPNVQERVFLSEAISCYRARAFRSAIVMTWCLAMDHLQRWILADAVRLAAFNAARATRYPKKGVIITKFDEFEEFKESEVIEVVASAGLITGDVKKVLKHKLDTRNTAAHPSTITIDEPQANEYILTLVNEVVAKLV
jgi:hypothetical protein